MGLVAKDKGNGDFEMAPEGTHVARCYRILDLGTQYSDFYKKSSRKVLIGWELPDEKMSDGRPFVVSKRYTMSLHERAALRKDLEGWRGRRFTADELEGFDLRKVLGVACLVNVVHNTHDKSTYANVSSVMALPKGSNPPAQINPSCVFDVDDPDMDVFGALPEGLQNVIRESEEWGVDPASAPGEQSKPNDYTPNYVDDDCPF